MLNNLKVSARLSILSIFPVLVLVIIVISAVNIFGTIQQGVDSLYKDRIVPLRDLKIIADDYAVLIIDTVNKTNTARMTVEEAQANLKMAQERIDATWKAYLETELTKEEAKLANEAKPLFANANDAIHKVEAFLQGKSGTILYQLNQFNGPLYDYIDPISNKITELIELQLRVSKEVNNTVHAHTNELTTYYIIGTLIAVGFLIFASLIVTRSITKPLSHMNQTMQTIEKNSDVTQEILIDGKDEFAQTATVFNQMMSRINQLMAEVQGSSTQLSAASEELAQISNQTNDSTFRQQNETDQVATAMNEMTASIHEISKSTEDAQGAAKQAFEISKNGRSVGQRSTSLLNSFMEEIANTSEIISNLENESQNIGAVVDVINSIAEQTNLLALNAAIEAARAGEQGRGFAVVADEVRTLAQRTQSSTQEIRDLVERLQKGSQNSVLAMKNGQEKADECRKAVSEGQDALEKIELSVQSIRDMNIQIAAALEEQSAVANDINRSVTSISQIAAESATAAQEVSQSSTHLSELASSMDNQVSRFIISK
ncbi:MAG: methyl-accepting chemotaxis protein [Gammaproteobacteria bacterium]|nr:methyl-accepting chemotaxis protein [Gammaproteobacteria bacterium]